MFGLFINAIVAGVLLGGFYAAVSVGITISFGMLDIANIAQPAFILLGCYAAYMLNLYLGLDPIVTGILMTPAFFALGMLVYQLYYHAFEKRGDQAIQGLAFFFGLWRYPTSLSSKVFQVLSRTVKKAKEWTDNKYLLPFCVAALLLLETISYSAVALHYSGKATFFIAWTWKLPMDELIYDLNLFCRPRGTVVYQPIFSFKKLVFDLVRLLFLPLWLTLAIVRGCLCLLVWVVRCCWDFIGPRLSGFPWISTCSSVGVHPRRLFGQP